MWESIERFIDRVLAPVPAHLLIISGMLLLGMTVVMPAWMETRELGWQVALMKVQAQRLDEQEQSYRKFNDALAADDPVLLERLAYYHLHLKPAGSATLTASVANSSPQESPSIAAARRNEPRSQASPLLKNCSTAPCRRPASTSPLTSRCAPGWLC